MCQDFGKINKVTEIAPMPQGDIQAKQLCLSGHCYIHVFDFAAGFYGVKIQPDSQPYITFYIEGRGYFTYKQMPFSVTGGPSEFGQVTVQRFHDLVAKITLELFIDDGGAASDSFDAGMTKLHILFECVHREKMLLSPSKLRLFMSEAVFAGAQVSAEGVSPDSAKLTAIVDWPIPADASHLEGFLGLTSYFRDLIKGYAQLEAPLCNILCQVPIPAGTKKPAYQRIIRNFKLGDIWNQDHTKMFMALKVCLVSEPLLPTPHYDRTPFILTTDGCQDAFAGVLAQRITTTFPGGKEVTHLHPIAFASKQTSTSEEKYKPFLLKFAVLKFALDKFSDIIYGYLVKVETDCQALQDDLMNDKLSATHARWQDSMLAHNIIDVQLIPGVKNIADGLSRQYENTPRSEYDGSSWTVSPDWEEQAGLIFGINQVAIELDAQTLLEWFKDEPVLKGVVEALVGMKSKLSLQKQKRAVHCSVNYMLEDGKLWYIGGGTPTRAITRRKCVMQKEAIELARQEHEKGGHFHHNMIKIALLDRI